MVRMPAMRLRLPSAPKCGSSSTPTTSTSPRISRMGSPDGIVVTDIRKDFRLTNQDVFEVIIDTFGDRRNRYVFATNPGGGRADGQIANEGRAVKTSWDVPWTTCRPDTPQ